MKKSLVILLILSVALFAAACGGQTPPTAAQTEPTQDAAQPGKTYQIKIATVGNDQHQSTIAAALFQEKMAELAGDTVQVDIYPNGALGGEREAAEGVQLGTIEMTVVTSDGALPAWVPSLQVLSIPYLFASKEEAYAVLDNTLQDYFAPLFEEQGFKHFGFCELGFRHFTNNVREVRSAADMAGLSIRVQEAPIWFALIESLGATATPVSFNELYTALQQGMVDGQENPVASIYSSRFNEVQDYMVLDGHTYAAESVIMNLDFYNGLPDQIRAAVDEAARYAIDQQRQVISQAEDQQLQELIAHGLQVVADPDLASFREATAGLYLQPEVTALVEPELVEMVADAVAAL